MAELPAALGGTPVVPAGMVQPYPHVTDDDRDAVLAALAGGDLTRARQEQAEGLAREFAEYLGVRHVVPTNSGTSALHLAVAGVGVEPGDEVICPAFTYWATAAAVLHHNAIPVFVDVEPGTWTMDPRLVEERITERTRAVSPVHIHGMPADMDPILEMAHRHRLAVIEDCAQSHGALYRGRMCGTIGDAAGFSLQATKLLTTGSEGGLFATGDDLICQRASLLQYLGELVVPGRERLDQEYNAFGLGWMYRGDVLGQAFARSQLRRLDEHNAERIRNCERLTERLTGLPGVSTPELPADRTMVYYSYTVRFAPEELGLDCPAPHFRDRMERALQAEGVPCGRWQTMPVPSQRIFQDQVGYGKGCPWRCPHAGAVTYDPQGYPVTQSFIDTQLYVLGIWGPNGVELMDRFADAFEKLLSQPEAILEIP